MWQDIILGAGSWIFLAALVPTMISRTQKPTFSTCTLTAVIMTVFAYAYYTLELWYAMVGAIVLALGWYVLTYQRWQLNREKSAETNDTLPH